MILLLIIKPPSKFGEEWGDELLNWVGMFTDVVYGEVSVWVGRILAKILILLLGWGIEWDFGKMGSVRINLSNWLSRGCMVLPLIGRPLLILLWQGWGRGKGEVGMFNSFEILMIGSWLQGMTFFGSWDPIFLQRILGIGWDGSWSLMGILISIRSLISCEVLLPLSFLGKVFGKLRPLGVFPSLFGL